MRQPTAVEALEDAAADLRRVLANLPDSSTVSRELVRRALRRVRDELEAARETVEAEIGDGAQTPSGGENEVRRATSGR